MPFLIRTLGATEIIGSDGMSIDLPPGKPFALLVHLAVERRPVRREELARLLWPAATRERALQSARQAIWLVRQALGESCIRGGEALDVDPEVVVTDLQQVRARIKAGRMDEALTLWTGGFLERMAIAAAPEWDAWVEDVARGAAREMGVALHRTALAERAAGRTDRALQLLGRAAEVDPWDPAVRTELIATLIDVRELDRAGMALSEARRDLAGPEFGAALDALETRLREALARRSVDRETLVRPEFVGRAAELADLLRLWRACTAGRVRVALVSGPTGIGKTRLTEELTAAAAAEGGCVVTVKATEAERALDLGLATLLARRLLVLPGARGVSGASDALLRALLPSLGSDAHDVSDAGAHPAAFADALLDLLGAVAFEAPLVVVLDDLHWADAPSRAVLTRVLRQARTEPILFVLTWRPADLPAEAERALDHLAREDATRAFPLRSLTPGEVAEMLGLLVDYSDAGAADRIVQRLHTATQGNPLFIVETLQALAEEGVLVWAESRWLMHVERLPDSFPLPRTLDAVIRGRLERLSEDAARVAAALAALPPRAGINELRRAAAFEDAHFLPAVGELVARDIARWQEGRLEFSHDQQREAVLRRWGHTARPDPARRWRRAILAAGVTGLLAVGGAAMSSVLSEPAAPAWGGGQVYAWFADTAVLVVPPRDHAGEWTTRPIGEPVPPGPRSRISGPFLRPDGSPRWYRTRLDPETSPFTVEWFDDGTERVIAKSRHYDVGHIQSSPDDRFVAYVIDDSTTAAYDLGVVIANLDGTDARRVVSGPSAQGGWSRDGDWFLVTIAGTDADTAVLVSPFLERGASLTVPSHAVVRWCGPERAAVWREAGPGPVMELWEPATGAVTPFAGRPPDVAMFACSPDGSALIGTVIADDHLETVLLDVATGERLPFPFGARGRIEQVAWLPAAPERVIARVRIANRTDTLVWGGQRRLTAYAEDHAGRRLAADFAWSTLDPAIVGVRPDGAVTGNRPGIGRVVARAGTWRADTATIVVTAEIDENGESGDVVFFERFESLDTTRWWIVGTPASRAVRHDGEPALLIPGDGNYADGVALRAPVAFPRGVTVELELKLPLTGAPNQYLQIHLLDGAPARTPPGTVEDWGNGGGISVSVPGVQQSLADLEASVAVNGIGARFDLPGDPDLWNWHRLGLRVLPDGTVQATFDGAEIGTGRMRVRDFTARPWTIAIVGAAQETELYVRNVRVWGEVR